MTHRLGTADIKAQVHRGKEWAKIIGKLYIGFSERSGIRNMEVLGCMESGGKEEKWGIGEKRGEIPFVWVMTKRQAPQQTLKSLHPLVVS